MFISLCVCLSVSGADRCCSHTGCSCCRARLSSLVCSGSRKLLVFWASELEGASSHWQGGGCFSQQKERKGTWELDVKMCSIYSVAALAQQYNANTVAEKHSVQAVPFFFIKKNFFGWQNTHNIKFIILTVFNLLFSGIQYIYMVGCSPHPPPKLITCKTALPFMVWLFFL